LHATDQLKKRRLTLKPSFLPAPKTIFAPQGVILTTPNNGDVKLSDWEIIYCDYGFLGRFFDS
jgi:hypothetical protein